MKLFDSQIVKNIDSEGHKKVLNLGEAITQLKIGNFGWADEGEGFSIGVSKDELGIAQLNLKIPRQPGAFWYFGVGDSVETIEAEVSNSKVGDIYLNTNTNQIYQRTETDWVSKGELTLRNLKIITESNYLDLVEKNLLEENELYYVIGSGTNAIKLEASECHFTDSIGLGTAQKPVENIEEALISLNSKIYSNRTELEESLVSKAELKEQVTDKLNALLEVLDGENMSKLIKLLDSITFDESYNEIKLDKVISTDSYFNLYIPE